MVKFSKELEAQLIPEWKDAFVDYWLLKKHVKKIKLYRSKSRIFGGSEEDGGSAIKAPVRMLSKVLSRTRSDVRPRSKSVEEELELALTGSKAKEMRDFWKQLGRELDKVDDFYKAKETEFMDRFNLLKEQVQKLLELKKTLKGSHESREPKNKEQDKRENQKEEAIKIDIPQTNPSSVIWEDIMGKNYTNKKKMEHAEKMIREAFVELYRGLSLLQKYRSLNMTAFTKIIKKFDKVSKQQTSPTYLKVVNSSYFATSDRVLRTVYDIETVFTKDLANGERKQAMKFLRPLHTKELHIVTFFVGLFAGVFITLFGVYSILAHMMRIFDDQSLPDPRGYEVIVYQVFITFALISLHIFLYGCNLLAWKKTRINHNFIFEFSTKTALKHRDAFFISTFIMTTVVGALMVHFFMLRSRHHLLNYSLFSLPGILILIFVAVLLFPFNIFYRSTRICFLAVLWSILLSPFYKVVMVNFFMADQLTSQIPLLRHIQFVLCYFIVDKYSDDPLGVCTTGHHFIIVSYIIPFLPYYWRALQCLRRFFLEGFDLIHLANAGKYISALIATGFRLKYTLTPTMGWLIATLVASFITMLYHLYWDNVQDWGFFTKGSKNAYLRDKLILKNTSIYYVAIAINFVLRLAWVGMVLRINIYRLESRILDFGFASLEVIRRCHWNFYRVENEHLNNVGKFRAVKEVPLPF